jgi:hypothetical protein
MIGDEPIGSVGLSGAPGGQTQEELAPRQALPRCKIS